MKENTKTETSTSGISHGYAEKTNSSQSGEEIIKKEQVGDSPFEIVEYEGNIWLGMANYRATEPIENTETNKKKLIRLVNNKSWGLIMAAIGAYVDVSNKATELKKEIENQTKK